MIFIFRTKIPFVKKINGFTELFVVNSEYNLNEQ